MRRTVALLPALIAIGLMLSNPAVNLRVSATSAEALQAKFARNSVQASQPLSLASLDFDEDGIPDLIGGYAQESKGVIAFQGGAGDSARRAAADVSPNDVLEESVFLSAASAFEVPVPPDFLSAGDFDADGHMDVVAAARGDNALYLMPGDGKGGFGQAQRMELPGSVTALVAGEINRRDGLADIAVGVSGPNGASALIFEGPAGALRAQYERYTLPAEATGLALGQLDRGYEMDLAIASGKQLFILSGRDRALSLSQAQQENARQPNLSHRAFPFTIASLAIGDFIADRSHQADIALLGKDGRVHFLERRSQKSWVIRGAIAVEESPSIQASVATWAIFAARVSGMPTDDLIVVDGRQRVHVFTTEDGRKITDKTESASSDAVGETAAALPLFSKRDARNGLAVLKKGATKPAFMTAGAGSTITVNSTADVIADDGQCSLREAIIAANTNAASGATPGECVAGTAGLDDIVFSLGAGTPTINVTGTQLPFIMEPVSIDGATGGSTRVELNGAGAGVGSSGLVVMGGSSTIKSLVINRFDWHGISVQINGSNVIENCIVGLDSTGTTALANALDGVLIFGANNNTIGGTAAGAGNVISGNGSRGLEISSGSFGNQVLGNLIGTGLNGTLDRGNSDIGVLVFGSNNTVGGTAAGALNIVSGNNASGIRIEGSGATGNLVQGNFIGTDLNGRTDLGNTLDGVMLFDAGSNTIGGTVARAGNVISGNDNWGVRAVGIAGSNLVQGDWIGTDASGSFDVGNSFDGVGVFAAGNTIGGAVPGAMNLISGNGTPTAGASGIYLDAAGSNTTIQGNLIGTDASCIGAVGNSFNGVQVRSSNNIIGGTTAIARNVISGNGTTGILLTNGSTGNVVQGNCIGTTFSGTSPLANGRDGITIGSSTTGPASNNTIGGTATGAPNVIAYNLRDGVRVTSGTGNAILSNSIFSNTNLAIDLGGNGVTANDAGDVDTGANNLQNYPVLTSAQTSGSNTTIQGTLNSVANATFTIQFFVNPACDASGYGEGKSYFGSTSVSTDGSGNATINAVFPILLSATDSVTATATSPTNDTSEFSACRRVAVLCSITCASDIAVSNDLNQCGAVVNYAAPAADLSCGTVNCTPPQGLFPIGTTRVDCTTATGPTCSFNVTVNDTQRPSLTCPANLSVTTLNSCQVVNFTTPTASDNCAGVSVLCAPASGTCFSVGATTVTCTATDASSNATNCSFIITVTPCTMSCPANVTHNTDAGQCGALVSYQAPSTTGDCGAVVCAPTSGSSFPKGVTTVNCTTGAGASCSFAVTVLDKEAPVITCPTKVTAMTPSPDSACATLSFTPNVTDNCPGTLVSYKANGIPVSWPPCLPRGVTVITVTATDAAGNSSGCSFNATVFDILMQDDINGNILRFSSTTGDFEYINCRKGWTMAGRGTVGTRSCKTELWYYGDDPKQRTCAMYALANLCTSVGTCNLQLYSPGALHTIKDSRMRDSTGACR